MSLPTIQELRRMSDEELQAYAEATGDHCAWDELNDRGAERQFAEPDYI